MCVTEAFCTFQALDGLGCCFCHSVDLTPGLSVRCPEIILEFSRYERTWHVVGAQ